MQARPSARDSVGSNADATPLIPFQWGALFKAAQVAVLSPDTFDNDMFWRLITEKQVTRPDIKHIKVAAVEAKFTESSEEYPHVHCPRLDTFLSKLHVACSSSNVIINIIDQCDRNKTYTVLLKTYLKPYVIDYSFMPPNDSEPSRSNDPDDYVGPDFMGEPHNPPSCCALLLRILAGFVSVLGAVAVVAACIFFQAASLNVVGLAIAGAGVVAGLSGLGMFRYASTPNRSTPSPSGSCGPFFGFSG